LEIRTPEATQECPICFLYYEDINTTKCCSANICTECFLQVRPQKDKHSACPFCNQQKLNISVAQRLTEQQIMDREKEEQQVNEARIRARGGDSSNNSNNTASEGAKSEPIKIPDSNGFGSSLERDSRVAMSRKRSESFASSDHSTHETNSYTDASMIQSMAMTPEERRRLEAEMRNQNLHPLALQVEAEAQQRVQQNERAYHRSHSHTDRRSSSDINERPSRRRGRGQSSSSGRDWNQIVEAFEHGGNGAVNSLDDLVVLEAAILLSMEEEARHANDGQGENNNNNIGNFDAAGHARDGFPLVRSFLASRGRGEEPATQQQVQDLARSLNSNRRRHHLLRSGLGSQSARAMADTALDTAAMLMRGVSEEEQMAMAIAASLQDQSNGGDDGNEDTNDNNNDEEGQGQATETDQAAAASQASAEAAIGVVTEEEEEAGQDHEVHEGGGEPQDTTVGQSLSPEEEIPDGVAIGVVTEGENELTETAQDVSPAAGAAAHEEELRGATDVDQSPHHETYTVSTADADRESVLTVEAIPIDEE
jgi:hypothetical protein